MAALSVEISQARSLPDSMTLGAEKGSLCSVVEPKFARVGMLLDIEQPHLALEFDTFPFQLDAIFGNDMGVL